MKNRAVVFLIFCIGICITACGTKTRQVVFPVSKSKLQAGIDSLYTRHPEYNMPPNWVVFNSWGKQGYDPKNANIFYFKNSPEEMYYVTFIADSTNLSDTTKSAIAIKAINTGDFNWMLTVDMSPEEKEQVQNRFEAEIIPKLEDYTKCKVAR